MSVTYVHNGKEVVMTGRRAVKQVRKQIRESARGNQPAQNEPHILYEITPAGDARGTFTTWVTLSELYLIEDTAKDPFKDTVDE